jgi:hypothetical protein
VTQLTLDFDPPKSESLKELLLQIVYTCGKDLKYVAADCGLSQVELSQRLHGSRGWKAEELELFIQATGERGKDVARWFASRCLMPQPDRMDHALGVVEAFERLLPQFQKAAEVIKAKGAAKR